MGNAERDRELVLAIGVGLMNDERVQETIAREFWGDDRRGWKDMTHAERISASAAYNRKHERALITKSSPPVAAATPIQLPLDMRRMQKMADEVVDSVKGYVHQLVVTDIGRQEIQMRSIGEQLRRIAGTDTKAIDERIEQLAARVAELERRSNE